jgi:hypothetical protein
MFYDKTSMWFLNRTGKTLGKKRIEVCQVCPHFEGHEVPYGAVQDPCNTSKGTGKQWYCMWDERCGCYVCADKVSWNGRMSGDGHAVKVVCTEACPYMLEHMMAKEETHACQT